MSDERPLPIMANRATVEAFAEAEHERGRQAGIAEAQQKLSGGWRIVNAWLATNEVEDFGYGLAGPAEPEPIVDLRTLPGWDELRSTVLDGIPAYSAGNLASLATTLADMPAPRGDQPRSVTLAVRLFGLGEVAVGDMLWDPQLLEWTWRPGPAGPRAEGTLDYPFRETQTPPSTVEVRP